MARPRRGFSRRQQSTALVTTALVGVCSVVCVVMTIVSCAFSSVTRNTGSHTISAAPTSPPLPTATPYPLDTGPYLGAVDNAFTKVLRGEQPSISSTDTTIAGQQVSVGFMFTQGTDGSGRVKEIVIYGAFPNEQAALPVIKTFLPPDAHYVRTVTKDVSSYSTVIHHVYTSALLAKVIDPSDFIDDLGLTAPIPPGTFEWYCWSSHGYINGPYDGCELMTRAPVA